MQPGRRITVLQRSKHDISCAVAIMNRHEKGLEAFASQEEKDAEYGLRARKQEAELAAQQDHAAVRPGKAKLSAKL